MEFTYYAYESLISLLRENGYDFCGYRNYAAHKRCVIMRHDIDNSPAAALKMARLEARCGISVAYFVLLRTDMYNPASARSCAALREIIALGHSVGLHFDETACHDGADIVQCIRREAKILSEILDTQIDTVSMHRPSKGTLEADYKIPGMINSYSEEFFKCFKYLSDSRRHWREPVENIVAAGEYNRLHILTHPFWYGEREGSLEQSLKTFIDSAREERYNSLSENIRNFEVVVGREYLTNGTEK